ncbi:hypothetical protein JZX86_27650 [Agrobacterium rosae]|uniref:hypothetical protein n=1 Tax=Agrobacterium rosae TaxID=1972867 RepID=UPI0019D33C3D|nr:hypothetical protein [Agrobacterium rosae]MBN7809098.1 hypothetical protein [Agrobacterium rosae]
MSIFYHAAWRTFTSDCGRFTAYWSQPTLQGFSIPTIVDNTDGMAYRAVIPHDRAEVSFRAANKRNYRCTSFFLPYGEIETCHYNTFNLLSDIQKFLGGAA